METFKSSFSQGDKMRDSRREGEREEIKKYVDKYGFLFPHSFFLVDSPAPSPSLLSV